MMGRNVWMLCVSIALCVVLATPVLAQQDQEELQFPTTEEEIVEALSAPPPQASPDGKPPVPGGLPSASNDRSLFQKPQVHNTRGLGGIVTDDVIDNAPKVGALILFDFNSAQIRPESIPLLREYGKALQGALADAVLVVAGHTDAKGSEQYNLALSKRRAESVRNFLMTEFHIADSRLIVKPYGENKPIDSNDTEVGRAKNRRVEFINISGLAQ